MGFNSELKGLNTTVVLGVLHIRYVFRHERAMFKHTGNFFFNCSSLILFIKDLSPKNQKMKFVYF